MIPGQNNLLYQDLILSVQYIMSIILYQLPFALFFSSFTFFFSTNHGSVNVLVTGDKMMNKIVITSAIMQLTI